MSDSRTTDPTRIKSASEAESKSAMWLNRGRELEERGFKPEAEFCYGRSEFWLGRANRLRGNI